MRIEGKEYRTIWFEDNVVKIIDQTKTTTSIYHKGSKDS